MKTVVDVVNTHWDQLALQQRDVRCMSACLLRLSVLGDPLTVSNADSVMVKVFSHFSDKQDIITLLTYLLLHRQPKPLQKKSPSLFCAADETAEAENTLIATVFCQALTCYLMIYFKKKHLSPGQSGVVNEIACQLKNFFMCPASWDLSEKAQQLGPEIREAIRNLLRPNTFDVALDKIAFFFEVVSQKWFLAGPAVGASAARAS